MIGCLSGLMHKNLFGLVSWLKLHRKEINLFMAQRRGRMTKSRCSAGAVAIYCLRLEEEVQNSQLSPLALELRYRVSRGY